MVGPSQLPAFPKAALVQDVTLCFQQGGMYLNIFSCVVNVFPSSAPCQRPPSPLAYPPEDISARMWFLVVQTECDPRVAGDLGAPLPCATKA